MPARVAPRPEPYAPTSLARVSAMKLSLARFMVRRITGSGGEVAVASTRPPRGAAPGRSGPTWATPTPPRVAFSRWAAARGGLDTWAARPLPA